VVAVSLKKLYQRALVIREEALGPDHPDVGYTVIGLGSLYETMGDLERALPYVARTVEIWEKALGPEHPQVMAVTETYADLLRRLGDEAGAKEAADRAASVREKLESE
jgi:tetratricopeptide (TPR) repeat protein